MPKKLELLWMTDQEIREAEERAEKVKGSPLLDLARQAFASIMLNHPDQGADCRFVLGLIDEVEAAREDIPKLCKEVQKLQRENEELQETLFQAGIEK